MAINITAEPFVVETSLRCTLNMWPPAPRDPTLDTTIYADPFEVVTSILGEWLNITIWADPFEVVTSISGDFVPGLTINVDPFVVETSIRGDFYSTSKRNWIKWTDIGSVDFARGKDNVAGERPLDWKGWIYAIKQLGDKIAVYGENGISVLFPSERYFGLNTAYRIGLKSKHAVTGDNVHYFIDNKGQLYSLGETLQKLDYSEYLSALNSPVMSYNVENDLVYICDGTLGYVYSPRSNSFGKGPINITGIGSQSGDLYVTAPATITVPTFEICTDIYDFGTRKLKTIFSLEIGVDLANTLQVAVDYRMDKAQAFFQTNWHDVNEKGIANITCNAREFRFRAKADNYEHFELDYIIINGEVLSH